MAAQRSHSGGCRVCSHPDRGRIELLLASGAAQKAVASKFDLSKDSIHRHLRAHISEERRAQLVAGPLKLSQLAERAAEENMSLIDYLAMVRSTLTHQLLAASEAGDRQGTAMLSGRLLECLRLIGALTGDLQKITSTTTHNTLVIASPLYATLNRRLMELLAPYPDAAHAVIEGLERFADEAINGAAGAARLLEGSPA